MNGSGMDPIDEPLVVVVRRVVLVYAGSVDVENVEL
jgi:hypothetical protein